MGSAVPRARPGGPAQETRTRQVDRTDELYARPDAGQSTPDHTTQDAVRVTTYSMTHAARSDSLSLSLSLSVCVCVCTLDRAVDTDRGRAYQYSRPIDSDGGLQPAFAL